MIRGFGEWRSWRKWVPEEELEGPCSVSKQGLKDIAWRWARYEAVGRGSRNPHPITFHRFKVNEVTGQSREALDYAAYPDEVLASLGDASTEQNDAATERAIKKARRRARSARPGPG